MSDVELINIALDGFNNWDTWESLGLEYLATVLRERGKTVNISSIDSEHMDECIDRIVKNEPKLVGFTLPCLYERKLVYLGKAIRNKLPNTHISVGNRFATDNAEKMLNENKWIDSVMRGEGEETIVELYVRLSEGKDLNGCLGVYFRENNRIIKNPDRPLINDLDSIPRVHRDMILEKKIAHAWFCSSRGCVNDCAFCNSRCDRIQKGKIIRLRSAENVVAELEYLYKECKCNNITFVDCSYEDPGWIGKERIRKIAEMVIEKKIKINYGVYFSAHNWSDDDLELLKVLRRSGLTCAFIGFESGYEKTLRLFNKKATVEDNETTVRLCNEAGISLKYGFIMYHPHLSIEEFKANNEFLYRNRLGYSLGSYYNELFVMKGTRIFVLFEREQLLTGVINPELGSCEWTFLNDDANKLYSVYTKFSESEVFAKLKSSGWIYKLIDIKNYFDISDMSEEKREIHNKFLEQLDTLIDEQNTLNYQLASSVVDMLDNQKGLDDLQTEFEKTSLIIIKRTEKLIVRYIYNIKKN
jgi:anaerobic magnesium-protoporphyrin IX monomethyl ester cyclase